jgi:hypothetical protein
MRTTYLRGMRLALSPWAADKLTVEDQRTLTIIAESMGVRVSVGNSGHEWTIRVASDMKRTRYGATEPVAQHSWHHLRGDLGKLIARCLDRYREAETWTPDEILTVASQSGIEVSRA